MRFGAKKRPHNENAQPATERSLASRPILVLAFSLFNLAASSSGPCDVTAGGSPADDNCTTVCPCKHDDECKHPYACPGGCRDGYARAPGSDECFHANDDVPNTSAYRRIERSASGTTLYRFVPAGRCYLDRPGSTVVKRWMISNNTTSVVEQLHVLFDVPPSETEYFLITFRTSLFRNVLFGAHLTLSRNGTYVSGSSKLDSLTFANSLQIDSADDKSNNKCPRTSIAAVLWYGQPVCPYGKWGMKCANNCRCPCNVAECHPSTGNCWTRSYACSPGTFGPFCSRNCSEMCGGSPRECHLTSGVCKKCDNSSRKGVRCEIQMTPGEVRAKWSACKNIPIFEKLTEDVDEEPKEGNSTKKADNKFQQTGSSVTLIVATIVVVIAFFVACVAYVLLIRHCASQKLKKSKHSENERNRKISMMSYSELRKEYTERFLASQHAEARNKEEPHADVSVAAALEAGKQKCAFDARKRSMAFNWTNPLMTIIKDVPQNAGIQPGSTI